MRNGGNLDPESIRSELQKVTSSKHFARSPQLRRFLIFAVEETLQGRGESLKGYRIAVEAMGRRPDFDPHTDPIVRVQAAHLRSKLKEYYETEGENDQWLIEFAAGSYVPSFRLRANLCARPAAAQPSVPRRTLLLGIGTGFLATGLLFVWWFPKGKVGVPSVELTQLTFDTGFTSHPSVSRDGRLLAYSSDRAEAGNMDIWIQALDPTGQPIRLTKDPAPELNPDLSRDGKFVAFRSSRDGGGIYVVPAAGGPARRLADGGYSPRFSPDGSWIAYGAKTEAGAAGVFVVPSAGGKPIQVQPESPHSLWPVWAPDGTRLAFLSADRQERTYDWWIASLELHGSAAVHPAIETGAAGMLRAQNLGVIDNEWGPTDWEGSRIFFRTSHDNNPQIMEIPISEGTLKIAGPARQLLSAPAEGSFRTRRSGGTLEIFFGAERRYNHIWSLAIDGAGSRTSRPRIRLTNDSSLKAGINNRFSLSPDGRFLLFTSKRTRSWNIWRKDLDTGREDPVTSGKTRDDYPVFSPRGSRFAFVRYEGARPATYVGDGAGTRKACEDCGVPVGWSSDNAIVSMRHGALWMVSAESGQRTRLFERAGWRVLEAAVAPGGHWLAIAVDQGKPKLQGYLAPFRDDGLAEPADWKRFAEEAFLMPLAWSAEGSRIFYFITHGSFRCLTSISLDPMNRRPASASVWVEHFHSFQQYPLNGSAIAVSRGRIAVTLAEHRSNIWLASLHAQPPGNSRLLAAGR